MYDENFETIVEELYQVKCSKYKDVPKWLDRVLYVEALNEVEFQCNINKSH